MSLGKIKIIIFIILASFFVPIEISAQRYSFETMEEFYELEDEEESLEQDSFLNKYFVYIISLVIFVLSLFIYFMDFFGDE